MAVSGDNCHVTTHPEVPSCNGFPEDSSVQIGLRDQCNSLISHEISTLRNQLKAGTDFYDLNIKNTSLKEDDSKNDSLDQSDSPPKQRGKKGRCELCDHVNLWPTRRLCPHNVCSACLQQVNFQYCPICYNHCFSNYPSQTVKYKGKCAKCSYFASVAYCEECAIPICSGCLSAHKSILCLSTHNTILFNENLQLPCRNQNNHSPLRKENKSSFSQLKRLYNETLDLLQSHNANLSIEFRNSKKNIVENVDFFLKMLNDMKLELLKESEASFNSKSEMLMRYFQDLATIESQCSTQPNGMTEYKHLLVNQLNDLSKLNRDITSFDPKITFLKNIIMLQNALKHSFELFKNHFFNSGKDPCNSLTGLNDIDYCQNNQYIVNGIPLRKNIYYCKKFGDYGACDGGMKEPSGITANYQNDFLIADAKKSIIHVFDGDGKFQYNIGKGVQGGFSPFKLCVVKVTGDIVVCERSPNCQISIFNQYGIFIHSFGSDILLHPKAIAVDHKKRIVVVESKIMRITIFDFDGSVFSMFKANELQFPNGVAVNRTQHIFISDNQAHCVKVFDYKGNYVRQIGGDQITVFPIGVGINENGHVLVADNHVKFHINVFTQYGVFIDAYESKVRHLFCYDVEILKNGYAVILCKDCKVYVYKYN